MTRIRFEDLPSTNTPRNATNLNKLNNVVISSTEPTTGEEVWLQKGKNLFDKSNINSIDAFLNSGTGVITETSNSFSIYLPCKSNTTYTIQKISSKRFRVGFTDIIPNYNVTTSPFQVSDSSTSLTITSGNNSKYLLLYCYDRDETTNLQTILNSIQIEEGSTATSYEPYINEAVYTKNANESYEEFYNTSKNSVVVSSSQPSEGSVWFQKGKNLFDKNKALIGYEINGSDGTVSVNNLYYVSDYIPVKPNTNYYLTKIANGASNCFYDINRNFISTIRKENGVITTPDNSNVYYMRFNGPISDLNNVQVEQNSTATSYDAYIDKKIYTKNDNGVYEEFYKMPSSLSEGQGTINSNYISDAENNHWEKIGNVVSYSFTLTTTGTWGTYTQFISNLPKPIKSIRFVGLNHNMNEIERFELSTNGEIALAYSTTIPTSNHTIEGHVTYLTND